MSYDPKATKLQISFFSSDQNVQSSQYGTMLAFNGGTPQQLTFLAALDPEVGTVVYVSQLGAGTVELVEGPGVTIDKNPGYTLFLAGVYLDVRVTYLGSGVWWAVGGLGLV